MKEFEKWILNDEYPILSLNDEEQREKGWRAALKWSQTVKEEITEEYQDSLYGCIKQSIAIDVELRGD